MCDKAYELAVAVRDACLQAVEENCGRAAGDGDDADRYRRAVAAIDAVDLKRVMHEALFAGCLPKQAARPLRRAPGPPANA